ncbi:hypothetical protein DICVIV_08454 [Dictyocaulus viviparus]|uniref:Uncharacterized protein n=1 Tax=Dictyocaulus viviparus TaxID=29172 RepID=A0A0D8XSZ9_DICVI|nr:hypothetical protein DICVIV_08454 [Dictyocaulus viviparus]
MATDSQFTRGFISQASLLYPRQCELCFPVLKFDDQAHFARHLRLIHATKEGGSYICRLYEVFLSTKIFIDILEQLVNFHTTFETLYGKNNVCQKLPLEGVSDHDYEAHVRRIHCIPMVQPVHCEKKFTFTST